MKTSPLYKPQKKSFNSVHIFISINRYWIKLVSHSVQMAVLAQCFPCGISLRRHCLRLSSKGVLTQHLKLFHSFKAIRVVLTILEISRSSLTIIFTMILPLPTMQDCPCMTDSKGPVTQGRQAEIVETTFSFPKFQTVPGRLRFFY